MDPQHIEHLVGLWPSLAMCSRVKKATIVRNLWVPAVRWTGPLTGLLSTYSSGVLTRRPGKRTDPYRLPPSSRVSGRLIASSRSVASGIHPEATVLQCSCFYLQPGTVPTVWPGG